MSTEERLCEDTVRMWPSTRREELSRQKLTRIGTLILNL